MATYEFRCERCGRFRAQFPMAEVPPSAECPGCADPARRVISAPHLSRSGSPAMRAIDAAARTASEPGVVRGPLPGRRPPSRVSTNPLHRKLPRP